MRFELNEKVIAIFLHIKGREAGFRNPMFVPWEGQIIDRLEVNVLTVTEHHKVPYEWASEPWPDHDGYVLRDQKGAVWHNQYPRFSSGQLDDSASWIFNRAKDDESSGIYHEDVTRVLDRIQSGIDHFADAVQKKQEVLRFTELGKMLVAHRNWLIKKVESEARGARIRQEQAWADHPDILHHVVKWDQNSGA